MDERFNIVNLSESAGRFLQPPAGPMTTDAGAMVRPELRHELTAALYRAFEHNERTLTPPIPVRFDGMTETVVLQVSPRSSSVNGRSALVFFLEGGITTPLLDVTPTSVESNVVVRLREDLQASRNLLQTSREQYETTAEELRAANEELQSTNEEYRSTAEELETSKEELQSINEELQTLNNELKIKLDMVSRSNNDLQNLMGATDIATLFLDKTMRIQRFTPRTSDLFSVHAGDEGRPLGDFTHRLDYANLIADADRVLADLVPIERTIKTVDNRWLTTRLRPYRTIDDKIEGVVVTFFDVTERHEANAAWAARQELLLQEFAHRIKNSMAVVVAVVNQTLKSNPATAGLAEPLMQRLLALSRSHDLLLRSDWSSLSLEHLAREQLKTHVEAGRLHIEGPPVSLNREIATPLGLVLNELATNAVKYGALSDDKGRVTLSWRLSERHDGRMLEMVWQERGGPAIAPIEHKGLGIKLIDHAIGGATAECEYDPRGLTWKLHIELART